jgi:hypothetical protein
MISRHSFFLLTLILSITSMHCARKMNTPVSDKIAFDYSAIDDAGLRNGEVAVFYEFCIPANDELLKEVLKIDAGVRVMKSSKGRIGCTDQQWLCINSTHSPAWKDKHFGLASLSYVEKIQETFWE